MTVLIPQPTRHSPMKFTATQRRITHRNRIAARRV
jgi:hypothetical protein